MGARGEVLPEPLSGRTMSTEVIISKQLVFINSVSGVVAKALNLGVLIWLQQYLLRRIRTRRCSMPEGDTGSKLSELIKKAIDDCELTVSEYNEILKLADADSVIDSQERALLNQLHALLANGTVKRVPDTT